MLIAGLIFGGDDDGVYAGGEVVGKIQAESCGDIAAGVKTLVAIDRGFGL